MASGGIRGGAVSLACPACEGSHPSIGRIGGVPILTCPEQAGDVLRYREGWTVFVVGKAKDGKKPEEREKK